MISIIVEWCKRRLKIPCNHLARNSRVAVLPCSYQVFDWDLIYCLKGFHATICDVIPRICVSFGTRRGPWQKTFPWTVCSTWWSTNKKSNSTSLSEWCGWGNEYLKLFGFSIQLCCLVNINVRLVCSPASLMRGDTQKLQVFKCLLRKHLSKKKCRKIGENLCER